MHEYPKKKEFAYCIIREWNLENTIFVIVLFFMKIRGRQGFGPLCKVMDYEDQ